MISDFAIEENQKLKSKLLTYANHNIIKGASVIMAFDMTIDNNNHYKARTKVHKECESGGREIVGNFDNKMSMKTEEDCVRFDEKEALRTDVEMLKQKCQALENAKSDLESNIKRTKLQETKKKGKLLKKRDSSMKLLISTKEQRDSLTKTIQESEHLDANVHRFLEYSGIEFGAEEDTTEEGFIALYFTKINPNDPDKKHFIYFKHLKAQCVEFEVSSVSPKYEGFTSKKGEFNSNSSSFLDVVNDIIEGWLKDC